MSYAVFSCDLDPVDRHLQGYGFEDVPPCDLIYRTAVPRLLELLSERAIVERAEGLRMGQRVAGDLVPRGGRMP